MKLKELHIDKMPGFLDRGFSIGPGLSAGLNVIYGANGSGKSTLLRAIRGLLYPKTLKEVRPLAVSSLWEFQGKELTLSLEGNSYRATEEIGNFLPPYPLARCFFLAIDDLFHAEDGDLASQIIKEAHGGYDLSSLKEALILPKFHGRSEWKLWNKNLSHRRQIESELQALSSKKELLEEIESAINSLQKEIDEGPAILEEIKAEELEVALDLVELQLKEFPQGMEKVEVGSFVEYEKTAEKIKKIKAELSAMVLSLRDLPEKSAISIEERREQIADWKDALYRLEALFIASEKKQVFIEEEARFLHVQEQVALEFSLPHLEEVGVYIQKYKAAIRALEEISPLSSEKKNEKFFFALTLSFLSLPAVFIHPIWIVLVFPELWRLFNYMQRPLKKRALHLNGIKESIEKEVAERFSLDVSRITLERFLIGIEEIQKARSFIKETQREIQLLEIKITSLAREDSTPLVAEKVLDSLAKREALESVEKKLKRDKEDFEEHLELILKKNGSEKPSILRLKCEKLESFKKLMEEKRLYLTQLRQIKRIESFKALSKEQKIAKTERISLALKEKEGLLEKKASIQTLVEAAMEKSALIEANNAVALSLDALKMRFKEKEQKIAAQILLEKLLGTLSVDSSKPLHGRWFSKLTKGAYSLQTQAGHFFAKEERSGRVLKLEELSRGTRLQLILSARLEFIDRYKEMPLFLDEALSHADEERFNAAKSALIDVAKSGRQVFYLTCQKEDVKRFESDSTLIQLDLKSSYLML